MPVEITLTKVDADLAAGDLVMACQRLRGLVTSFPERLDLRERLADVYRQREDTVQAGRWSYLADERIDAETRAFEKATADPLQRMYALMWPVAPEDAATPTARERLAALLDEARARTRDPRLAYEDLRSNAWRVREHPSHTDWIFIVAAVLVIGLFVIGVIDGIRVLLSLIL